MANSFTQIHIQAVFAVKFRDAIILPGWQTDLHKYITGVLQKNSHKMLAINSMPDHMHLLFGFRPTQSLADLMRTVKSDSSEWINRLGFTPSKFRWQEGYGAFSYSKSQIPTVATYIENQQQHHKKEDFITEYKGILKQFEIEYEEKFLFQPLQ
jgi:REP element-mobilizing transposase RayT